MDGRRLEGGRAVKGPASRLQQAGQVTQLCVSAQRATDGLQCAGRPPPS